MRKILRDKQRAGQHLSSDNNLDNFLNNVATSESGAATNTIVPSSNFKRTATGQRSLLNSYAKYTDLNTTINNRQRGVSENTAHFNIGTDMKPARKTLFDDDDDNEANEENDYDEKNDIKESVGAGTQNENSVESTRHYQTFLGKIPDLPGMSRIKNYLLGKDENSSRNKNKDNLQKGDIGSTSRFTGNEEFQEGEDVTKFDDNFEDYDYDDDRHEKFDNTNSKAAMRNNSKASLERNLLRSASPTRSNIRRSTLMYKNKNANDSNSNSSASKSPSVLVSASQSPSSSRKNARNIEYDAEEEESTIEDYFDDPMTLSPNDRKSLFSNNPLKKILGRKTTKLFSKKAIFIVMSAFSAAYFCRFLYKNKPWHGLAEYMTNGISKLSWNSFVPVHYFGHNAASIPPIKPFKPEEGSTASGNIDHSDILKQNDKIESTEKKADSTSASASTSIPTSNYPASPSRMMRRHRDADVLQPENDAKELNSIPEEDKSRFYGADSYEPAVSSDETDNSGVSERSKSSTSSETVEKLFSKIPSDFKTAVFQGLVDLNQDLENSLTDEMRLVENIAHYKKDRDQIQSEILKTKAEHFPGDFSKIKSQKFELCLTGNSPTCDDKASLDNLPFLKNLVSHIPEELVLNSKLLMTDGDVWQFPDLTEDIFTRPSQYSLVVPFLGTGTVNVAGQKVALTNGQVGLANLSDYPYQLQGHGVMWYVMNVLKDDMVSSNGDSSKINELGEQGGLQQALTRGALDLSKHDDKEARMKMSRAFDMYLSIWDNPEKPSDVSMDFRPASEQAFEKDTDFVKSPSTKKPNAIWPFNKVEKCYIQFENRNLNENRCTLDRVRKSFFPLHLSLRDHLVRAQSLQGALTAILSANPAAPSNTLTGYADDDRKMSIIALSPLKLEPAVWGELNRILKDESYSGADWELLILNKGNNDVESGSSEDSTPTASPSALQIKSGSSDVLGAADLPMVVTLAGARKLSHRISLLNSFPGLEEFFQHALGKSKILKKSVKFDSILNDDDDGNKNGGTNGCGGGSSSR